MISLHTIVTSGLRKTDVYQRRRSILLSNYISLILSGAVITLATVRSLVFHSVDQSLFIDYVIGTILFLLPIVFNRFYLTTFSRLYLSLLPTIFVWFVFVTIIMKMPVIETTTYDSLRIFLLALSCVPYLLLDRQQLPVFILGILPSLISIVFFEQILGTMGLDHITRGFPETEYHLIQMRTIVSYLVINSCCIVFQIIIQRNDDFNRRLLLELKDQSDEIAAQNEELMQSEETLSKINLHLESLVEERTRKIREQNEILLKYAYTNAHQVRGPLARVLGLIEVSRIQSDLDFPWLFEQVEFEAKAIDVILKRIATDLEN